MANRKCPFCGSTNVSRDVLNAATNTAKETVGALAGLVPGLAVGFFMRDNGVPRGKSVAEKISGEVHDFLVGDTLTKKYTCDNCGRSFTIKELSGWSAKG